MAMQFDEDYKNLTEKVEFLIQARATLVSEFPGSERLISMLIIDINPWFLIPDLRKMPYIIDTGKNSINNFPRLIKRFSELLGFDNSYFHLDFSQIKVSPKEWLKELSAIADLHEGRSLFASVHGIGNIQELKENLTALGQQEHIRKEVRKQKNPADASQWVFFISQKDEETFPGGMDSNETLQYRSNLLLRLFKKGCRLAWPEMKKNNIKFYDGEW